jgi:hypothetical protein
LAFLSIFKVTRSVISSLVSPIMLDDPTPVTCFPWSSSQVYFHEANRWLVTFILWWLSSESVDPVPFAFYQVSRCLRVFPPSRISFTNHLNIGEWSNGEIRDEPNTHIFKIQPPWWQATSDIYLLFTLLIVYNENGAIYEEFREQIFNFRKR